MKLNLNCIRDILLTLSEKLIPDESGYIVPLSPSEFSESELSQYEKNEVMYWIRKLMDEGIIIKGKKYVDKGISVETYKKIVTDLIGIRVLHLFKDDWRGIHEDIMNLWEIRETPQINIRRGD